MTIRSLLCILAAALLLAGCGITPVGDRIRSAAVQRGAAAYDQGLDDACWYVCQAASIGSVRRQFGGDDGAAMSYRQFCDECGGRDNAADEALIESR